MTDLIIAARGTWKLLSSKRLWMGPDRLGWVIEVMEWISDQPEARRR